MFDKALENVIQSALPMLIIFVVVISVVRITSVRSSGKKFIIHEEILNLLFIVYVLLLFELLTGTENSYGSGFNIIPFKEIFRYEVGTKNFIYNVFGNILIFIPFGYFVSRYIKVSSIFQIIVDAVVTSLTVEIVQLKIGRSFDIDDILLNFIGAVLGYFLYVGLDAIRTHLPRFLQKDFIYDILCIIILGICILYVLNVCGIRWY